MKKLSKRIISLVLALVMAMPVMLILPSTASAEATDEVVKILEWDFVTAKPTLSSAQDLGNSSFDTTVNASTGSATMVLHNYSGNNWAYDGNNGVYSADGVAYLSNLKNYLADGKNIEIKFTMAVNGKVDSSHGVFAIGSAYVDGKSAATTASDLVYLSNTGEIKYKSTSSNTDIHTGSAVTATANTYYEYKVSFTYSTHTLDVYRDGTKIATKTDNAITKDNFGCIVLGSHIPNNFGNSHIKNLTVSISQPDATVESNQITAAQNAISAYEAKMATMSGSNVLRNMYPAYKAYVNLNEALDAVKYGNSRSAQIVEAINALTTATANMNSYWTSGATASAGIQMRDDTSDLKNTSYVKNLVYAAKGVGYCSTKTSNSYAEIAVSPTIVALYRGDASNNSDANAILIPVMFGFNNQEGRISTAPNRSVYTCYPANGRNSSRNNIGNDTSEFKLQSNWRGYDDSGIYRWNTAWSNGSDTGCVGISSSGFASNGKSWSGQGTAELGKNNTGYWRGYSNYMRYTGSTSGFTNRLKTINQDWYMLVGYKSNNNQWNQWFVDDAEKIYLIDYRNVDSTVNTYLSAINTIGKNISNYKEGGALSFIENLTYLVVDVDNANYSSNAASVAQSIATGYTNGLANIASSYSSITTDSGKYQALRNALDLNGVPTTITNNGGSISSITAKAVRANNGTLTISGHSITFDNYAAFQTAYDNALGVMKNLGTLGYNTNSASNYTDATNAKSKADALVTAFNNLHKSYTVTYTKNGGAQSAETVEIGGTLKSIPANTATVVDNGNGTHECYVWPAEVTPSFVPWENKSYTETTATESCSLTASQHYDATADTHGNGYTCPKCSVCGHVDTATKTYDSQDFSTYNSAMDAYNGIVNASDYAAKYTSASRTDYEGAVSSAGIDTSDQTLSPTAITSAASAVTEAQSNLVIQSYTITFVKADETTETTSKNYGTSAADVGTAAPALPANYFDDTYHYSYAWDIAFGIVTGTATYTQQETSAAHDYDSEHTAATTEVHGNGYTVYTCDCGKNYTTYDAQDFTAYNSALDDYGTTYAEGNYTTSSKADYKTAVEAAEINTADVTLSPKAISDATTAIGNAKSTLDPLADLTEFDKAYAKADALLKDLAGKTAQYDEDSVQALIDAVTTDKVSTGTNITAGTIAAATTARADYGKAVEDDAKELTENIYDAIEGLTIATIIDEETSKPVDTSVYDSLVNTINNLDPDAYEDVYDEEIEKYVLESAQSTINSAFGTETLEYAGEEINVVTGISSQGDVDAAADVIQSALTVCTKKYTISRTGVTDFGVTNGKEEGGKVNYGATLTCKSSDNDTAWFLEVETGSMHKKLAFQSYGKTLKTKVLGATTVKAIKRDSTNNCKVIVYRNYGDERRPIQYATFVPSGTDFTLPASPAIAYTTFNGYSYKGGDAIAANGEGEYIITVTGDVEIFANYTPADADCAINATDINSVAHNSTVSYNDKVELDGGDGAYGWVEQVGTTYRPFYKGQKVTFFATESTTLVAVNEETFESYGTAPIINMRKGGVIVSESKYMFNAQIVPGDADIRECGILLAAPSSKNGATPITPADSQVIIENSGQQVGYAILRAKSTKLVGANQFTVAINNVPAGYKYRGYIIYHDGTSLQTVYSDVLTK